MYQVECEEHGITVTKANKVDHFMSQIYACNLFEANVLDNWEESDNRSWGATQPHFTKQYVKECITLERDKSHNNYEGSAALRETPRHHTIETPNDGSTAKTEENIFAAEME